MTTIAAVWTPAGVALGGDRRMSRGTERWAGGPKVRQVAPWLLVGTSGGLHAFRWLRDLVVAGAPASLDEAAIVLDEALASWRALPVDEQKHAGVAATPWGLLHLGCDGGAWPVAVERDLGLAVACCGSGADYAQGAVVACPGLDAADLVRTGLIASARFDTCTGDGFDVLTVELG